MSIIKLFLLLSIFSFLAAVVAAILVSASAENNSIEVNADSATQCLMERAARGRSRLDINRLSPERKTLFYNVLAAAIKEHRRGALPAEWFVGTPSSSTGSSNNNDEKKTKINCAPHYAKRLFGTPPNAAGESILFLVQFMPKRDLVLPIGYILDTVTYSLRARQTFAFARNVEWHIFLNDVLPYSVLTEDRVPWRPLFFNYFNGMADLKQLTSSDAAAQWLNANSYNMPNSSVPRIKYYECQADWICSYDVFQTLKRRNASCTGLSLFLISSLRSVGLPGRATGTPHWNLGPKKCPHGDQSADCGDHTWTETWSAERLAWSFQDSDGNIPLNSSWFYPLWTMHQVPYDVKKNDGFVNHSIWASSWAPSGFVQSEWGGDYDPLAVTFSGIRFPMTWNWTETIVSAWGVTRRYLQSPKF